MSTNRRHTRRIRQIKPIAMLLAAAFLGTVVAISPARAKHDSDDEDEWHHEHKEHHKHWHEYERHVYYPPPVIYGPPPGFYVPPPPVVYAPPAPSINIVIPLPVPR